MLVLQQIIHLLGFYSLNFPLLEFSRLLDWAFISPFVTFFLYKKK
jgi:hypothetical protein